MRLAGLVKTAARGVAFPLILTTLFSCAMETSSAHGTSEKGSPKTSANQQTLKIVPKGKVPKSAGVTLLSQANKFYQNKDYAHAYDYYVSAWNRMGTDPAVGDTPSLVVQAHLGAIRSADHLARWAELQQLTQAMENVTDLKDNEKAEVLQYRLRSLTALGYYAEALQKMHDAKNPEQFKGSIQELVDTRLRPEELSAFVDKNSRGFITSMAYLRLSELSAEEKDFSHQRADLQMAVSADPQSDSAKRASEALLELDSTKKTEPKTIGVVLPMTGKYAAISQKALRGIELGLGLGSNPRSSFRLAVTDSEGNPDNARRAVERLVKEDNCIAIIGSLLSKTAPAVAFKANELGVPSVALSQKAGITDVGPTVFRDALTSEMQVRALVKTSMENLGLKRFAILYPNDAYGVEFANLFWDEVLARGGSIQGAQIYSDKETDFHEAIERLVGTYYLEARDDEYKKRFKDWSDKQTKRTGRTVPPADLLPPIVDFDAIFIPDSAKSLGQISAMLASNKVKGVKILGTNLWNVPNLSRRAGPNVNEVVFVDSLLDSSSHFVSDYRAQFGDAPGAIESQAYDAALVLRTLITGGATSRESLIRALSEVKNFPGSSGLISMTSQREFQRPVSALKIEGENYVPLLPELK